MDRRISATVPRCPQMRLSGSSEEQLLSAVANEDLPPRETVQPPAEAGLPDVPVKSAKRHLEEIDRPAAKRACFSTEPDGEIAKPADETTIIQHPTPKPAPSSCLQRFFEPSQPGPHSYSLDSFVSQWLESVVLERTTCYRLDSYLLSQLPREPVLRQGTMSAPQMGNTRDTDRLAPPPTLELNGSRLSTDTDMVSAPLSEAISSGTCGRSLVNNPQYRTLDLVVNNIHFRSSQNQLPKLITDLIDQVRRDRDSPGPSLDQVRQDTALEEVGMDGDEVEVTNYFRRNIFPRTNLAGLQCTERQPMARHTVPNVSSRFKVSNPVPDMLYGYHRLNAFSDQVAQLMEQGMYLRATNQRDLLYPFLVVEFKGNDGSMPGAINQCLGGSASCVNVAERLNHELAQCKSDEIHPFNTAAFSIAMNGLVAQVHVSWKQNEVDYYMAKVDSFALQNPRGYLEFRRCVLNIIDWGKGPRLNEIRSGLGVLLEESRKKASEAAKARTPPPDISPASSKRAKASSWPGPEAGIWEDGK